MKRPEDRLQRDAVRYLRTVLPPERYQVAAVPNGGRRGPAEASMLKATGLLPGFADVGIFGPHGRCWLLEFKAGKGKLNDNQEVFQLWCIRNGFPYVVARSLDDVQAALSTWRLDTREAA